MARVILPLILAVLVSVGGGVGAAVLARTPALIALTADSPAEILYSGATDQVLRLLAGHADLNASVTLDRPVADWPAGETVVLIEALVSRDNDDLLLLALALQPEIEQRSWRRALCVAARKGKGSLLPIVLERLDPVADPAICDSGALPSALAAAANHNGAAEELRRAGY